MRSKEFTAEVRGKFLGTSAYLAWTNQFPSTRVRYILVFEPPQPLDAALLVTQSTALRSQIPNLRKWSQPISVAVLTMAEWNMRFPDYPANK